MANAKLDVKWGFKIHFWFYLGLFLVWLFECACLGFLATGTRFQFCNYFFKHVCRCSSCQYKSGL